MHLNDGRIGSTLEERKDPDWEKGQIRPTERFWVSRRIGSMMIETENWSGCADW